MANWAEVRRVKGASFGRVSGFGVGDEVPTGNTARIRFVDVAGINPAPKIGDYYDPNAGTFSEDPPAAIPKPVVTPAELWFKRVTNNERGRIFALADDGGTLSDVQRGRLKAFLAYSMANNTPLDNPEAVTLFNALENAGALSAGRAAEILSE